MTERAAAQLDAIASGYSFTGASLRFGAAMSAGDGAEPVPHADIPVNLPLSVMNRHGLVAGATGTGKTTSSSSSLFIAYLQVRGQQAVAGGSNPGRDLGAKYISVYF